MKQLFVPVISCSEAIRDVYIIWVEAPQIADKALPGQFVTVRCGEEILLRRPLSIHKVQGDYLAFLFAVVGEGTEWLSLRSKGDFIDLLGPLGNGFKIDDDTSRLLVVAGGIGIAPLVHLAERAGADGHSVKMILGVATASQLCHEVKGVEMFPITEDGSAGDMGVATDLLPSLVGWADQIFACGPVPMYRSMAGMMPEFRDKPVQILLEEVMGCGVGACRGCAVPTRQGMKMVCQDGPVFDLREIIWEEMGMPR